MNTILGKNKTLYLSDEIKQHYSNNTTDNIIANTLNYYLSCLSKNNREALMFVVPDKSVICRDNLPETYNENSLYRHINYIKPNIKYNFIDLNLNCKLTSSDYYLTDSHINDVGSLKITKEIMKHFISDNDKINEIDKVLQQTTMHNFQGDLTSPINLKNQALVTELNLCENTDKIRNIMFNSYENIITSVDIKYRFCFSRPSIYVYNKNAIINKIILIYGDSTTSNKIHELISFYFEKTFFYWNHFFVNADLIDAINPDIIIDIRTERFLDVSKCIAHISTYNSNYNMNVKQLTYNEIYNILVNLDLYTFNNVVKQINSIDEIKNNLHVFSYVLTQHTNLITPVININKEEALSLHKDLLIFYNPQTDIGISDLKLKQHLITNKKKYKYENIPVDFNPKDYIELNKDLQYMTEFEAKTHYEYQGYKENRKYVNI
jgi:hypothetical protein